MLAELNSHSIDISVAFVITVLNLWEFLDYPLLIKGL